MRISVIIPTYNYGHYIDQAIQSVLDQSFKVHELIIIDDGSTDNTSTIIEQFRPYFNERMLVIKQANEGPSAARNKGIERATGDYLLFLDADDTLTEEAFKHFRAAVARKPAADVFVGAYFSQKQNGPLKPHRPKLGQEDKKARITRMIEKKLSIVMGSALIKRHVCQLIRFPTTLRCNEDVVFHLHIMAKFDAHFFQDPVVIIRGHEDSQSHSVHATMLSPEEITNIVFCPTVMPIDCLGLKKKFFSKRCLSLFRTHFLSGNFITAKRFYHEAIKAYPMHFFNYGYAKKYVRLLLS